MAKATTLPLGITKLDTTRPAWDAEDQLDTGKGDYGQLTFHKTQRFGWCITTLFISRGKRGQPDRSYGIAVDGEQTVSVGNGPHVTETFTLYFRESRAGDLQRYHDLYVKGLQAANAVRDRRSSRIAQGQEMRAQGRTRWNWDV